MPIFCYEDPISGGQICRDTETGEEVTPPGQSPVESGAPGGVETSPPSEEVMGPPLPPGYERPFVPKAPIADIVRLPDGGAQVIYATPPGNIPGSQIAPDYLTPNQYAALTAKPATESGGISPSTLYTQQQLDLREQARLAEDQRQFQEKFGFEKAAFDQKAIADAAQREQNAALTREQLDVQRGNTLLNLGQRPDTLIKYLYALRGQQTPQAIAGTTTNLPGYQGLVGQPNPQGAGAGGVSSSAPSAPAPNPVPMLPGTAGMLAPQPASLLQNNAANPNYEANLASIAAQSPALTQLLASAQGGAPASLNLAPANPGLGPSAMNLGPGITYNADRSGGLPALTPQQSAQAQTDYFADATGEQRAAGRQFYESIGQWLHPGEIDPVEHSYIGTPRAYAEGGVISEPMIAVGLNSGRVITMGEEAPAKPETVVPQGKSVADVKGMHSKSSYQTGGSLGYDPSRVPTLGESSSEFFNNPYLKTVVDRGYNSAPSTPLFPQVGIATGGGQSLIPSMQRLNSLLPSEQSLYAGALQDEFGANPEDVFTLARRLAPQVSGLRTPRFSN